MNVAAQGIQQAATQSNFLPSNPLQVQQQDAATQAALIAAAKNQQGIQGVPSQASHASDVSFKSIPGSRAFGGNVYVQNSHNI